MDIEMDPNSSDIEFFDFENVTEEEIQEIQAILKGPGNNGCVELPWETIIEERSTEAPESGDEDETAELEASTKDDKDSALGQALQFTSPLSSPVAQLPPPVETYVTMPTTVGYPNTPYFVSRTIPYLRAYSHMGVPFFACPIPGAGDTSYGQFVPVIPASSENTDANKSRMSAERYNRRSKKKSESLESDIGADSYRDIEKPVSVPISSTDRPTSVSLVPLQVPPPAFTVAGGTIPLHGYPPGLHTLPYTHMSGPQGAPSPAMYYVPVLHHPYGSYIPSPPQAPMVLPVNIRPETADVNCLGESPAKSCSPIDMSKALAKPCENIHADIQEETLPCESKEEASLQSGNAESEEETLPTKTNCEVLQRKSTQSKDISSPKLCLPPVETTAKSSPSTGEEVTDCVSSPPTPSPDHTPTDIRKCLKEEVKESNDTSRCWADLFKKPEVNGIDRHNPVRVTKDIANGKVYSVPASDGVH